MSAVRTSNCSLTKKRLPSFNPVIYSLSQTFSYAKKYSVVFVKGENFFPNGSTYINFGKIKNIPVTYFGSFAISFIVPVNALAGDHKITAVNIYNGNFSYPIQYTYPANLNESNPIIYTLL